MNCRVLPGAALLVLAAGIVAGCGGGGHSAGSGSAVPAASAPACPEELPANGTVALCIPENNGVGGKLTFTVAGLPAGVTADIAASSVPAEPQTARRKSTARRKTASAATALEQWAVNIADTASGANATVTAPTITLTGVANASSVVVELRDQKGDFAVFAYSLPESTTTESTYAPSPTGGESAATLLATCFDQDTTCYLAVVANSLFEPAGVPTSSAISTPEPSSEPTGSANSGAPTQIPTTVPASGMLSDVIVTNAGAVNEIATVGATPAPAFPLNGGTITWGSPSGEALFSLSGSDGSSVNIKYWGGQAPSGCTPPAESGGSGAVKAVIYSAEFSGWIGTNFEWSFAGGNLFSVTPVIAGVAPNGTYYGLIAPEGSCSSAEIVNASGPPANLSPFVLGPLLSPLTVNEAETYVIEIWYQ